MSILREMDKGLLDAMANADRPPREMRFLIVLNTEANLDFLEALHLCRNAYVTKSAGPITLERYQGAVLAVTHDQEMPRVSVYARGRQA
jgi:hypothetical protein